MGRIIKILLIVLTLLLIGFFIINKLLVPTWVYDLPNDYKIRKTSDYNVVLGVEIDGDFITEEYGVEEYVAQFQYNDNFIGLKTLNVEGEDTKVNFYLVNTKEKEVRGPYSDEESYLAVVGVWSEEVLGDWITTTEVPEGARFN